MSADYSIRLASSADAVLLPDIERSAGDLFRSLPDLAWIADHDVQRIDQHFTFIAAGAAWVGVDGSDTPVAFLNGERMGQVFHIWEMSVHADHQRQGLGAKLIAAARAFALGEGFTALTLTTFRSVAWNDAFYARQGFAVVEGGALTPELRRILSGEVEAGIPAARRCAMVMKIWEQQTQFRSS